MVTEGVVVVLIATFGGGLMGAVGTIATNHFMRPRIKADAYKSASEGFAASSAALMERIRMLEDENQSLRNYIKELERRLNKGGLAMK